MEIKKILQKSAWIILLVFISLLIGAINLLITSGIEYYWPHITDEVRYFILFITIIISSWLIRPLLIKITKKTTLHIFLRILFILLCFIASLAPLLIHILIGGPLD